LAFEDDRKRRKALDARVKEKGHTDVSPKRAPSMEIPPSSPTFTTQEQGQRLGGPSARRGFTNDDDDSVVAEQ
jgi:hypothetical protein